MPAGRGLLAPTQMKIACTRGVLGYEARVVGAWVLALPLFAGVLFVIAAGLMAYKQAHPLDIQHMAMTGLEGGLPLVAGIALATIASQDSAIEVQLTMPLAYRLTMMRRFALVLGLTVLLEVGAVLVLAAAWPWALSQGGIAYLLAWLPTLL